MLLLSDFGVASCRAVSSGVNAVSGQKPKRVTATMQKISQTERRS